MIGLLVAALGGAAVGLERQWSGHAEGPSARFAGFRTFTMLGALAGISGLMWTQGAATPAAILLGGAVALTVAGYVAASGHNVEGTTEVAALIVLAAGVLAGMGFLKTASGIFAIQVLLLVEKSRLHGLVQQIDDIELRAGVRFGVMALVVLPLLPEGPYGPLGGVRPRVLWALVLFFSGLSFLGHVMRRIVGAGRGYFISGIAGGVVSSTNVTLTFARESQRDRPMERALAFGAVGANAMLYARVFAATAVLNLALVAPLVRYLLAPAVIVAVVSAVGARRSKLDAPGTSNVETRNPLQLRAALQMAVLFQAVMMFVSLARETWGSAGVVSTAAVLGLTDVDALTLSMSRAVSVLPQTAALAIAVGVFTNNVLKMVLAFVFGSPTFRIVVGGSLILMNLAAAAALFLVR